MVSLVEQMLELHERSLGTPQEQEVDWEIDTFVYELYGLPPHEINIVEGSK
jgi:hypothetical protein